VKFVSGDISRLFKFKTFSTSIKNPAAKTTNKIIIETVLLIYQSRLESAKSAYLRKYIKK
jgi:hypothetical protein